MARHFPHPIDVERAVYDALSRDRDIRVPWDWWADDNLRSTAIDTALREGRCGATPDPEIPEICRLERDHNGDCSWTGMSHPEPLEVVIDARSL